ncbi:interferon-induced protein 44-like [Paramormyrops kingsleyae]|uniref:Interferon-induced protein 44-like n=1 Tax=Paramormyrops kingsleyae TaxID=1676925 RepID=A0A3B3R085_9TELE|nr:interferon-induced protein 44-like [Paramormyrops kingsleyae]
MELIYSVLTESWTKEIEERKPEILQQPWRTVEWNHSTKINIMQYLKDYKPTIDSVPRARILLIGAVGAGKSSFFNSINSIFRGNITSQANAGYQETSLTLQYRIYQVKAGRGGQPLAFLLCDTMGLEPAPNRGVDTEDIVGILKGYIPDEYKFNPMQPFQAQAFNTLAKDRIHCVVYVMDSTSPGLLHPETKKKVDEIRKKINHENVPVMALLTKVDKVCPHVEKDLKNVYYSCHIRDLIKKASGCLGIAESNVLPVKNYSSETELNDTSDILLLSAMKQMLNFSDNYIDNFDKDTH